MQINEPDITKEEYEYLISTIMRLADQEDTVSQMLWGEVMFKLEEQGLWNLSRKFQDIMGFMNID